MQESSSFSDSDSFDYDQVYGAIVEQEEQQVRTLLRLTEEDVSNGDVKEMINTPGLGDMMKTMMSRPSNGEGKKHKSTKPEIPFCISESIPLVPLDSDLVAHPYLLCRDGEGLNPMSTRPFFIFSAMGNSVLCGTEGNHFSVKVKHKSEFSDYLSVVDVFDRYGLEMAYSYLHHVYHHELSIAHPSMLVMYILGSLSVISPGIAEQLHNALGMCATRSMLLAACSVLLTELVVLDSKQPKLSSPIQAHTTVLPIEILAQIFDNVLISKAITEQVLKRRRRRELRYGEMRFRASGPRVRVRGGLYFSCLCDSKAIYVLTRDKESGDYALSYRRDRREKMMGEVVLFSPLDYARLRYEKPADTIRKMLSEVNTEDEAQVCAWILMLLGEPEQGTLQATKITKGALVPTFLRMKETLLASLL